MVKDKTCSLHRKKNSQSAECYINLLLKEKEKKGKKSTDYAAGPDTPDFPCPPPSPLARPVRSPPADK